MPVVFDLHERKAVWTDQYKGKGFGEWLLIDALRKLLAASDAVVFPVVIVDAKDGAKQFYEQFGFQEFQDSESKLYFSKVMVESIS